MKKALQEKLSAEELLVPETETERLLLESPEFQNGLYWGSPRFGHPEGKVAYHIREVLDNVDKLELVDQDRQQLRLITFVHDTFKYKEDKSSPRDWSKHHGIIARHFLEKFISTPHILDIVELHDEAYYCWRLEHIYRDPESGKKKLEDLLNRIGNHIQLYYLFFKCDTRTGDKNQAPLKWFEKTIKGIKVVDF